MMSGSIVAGSGESDRIVIDPLCRGHDQCLAAQVSIDCGDLYQTRQACGATIGCPAVHANAFWNSSMFDKGVFTRARAGECGSIVFNIRIISGF